MIEQDQSEIGPFEFYFSLKLPIFERFYSSGDFFYRFCITVGKPLRTIAFISYN